MKTTTIDFDLKRWRQKMRWTQERAAQALGVSTVGYRIAEYRAADLRRCNKTLALLAQKLEHDFLAAGER